MVYEELVIDHPKKVLIIDDVPNEVQSIRNALKSKEIPYEYRNVDLTGESKKLNPIESVELVFLDLNYNTGILGSIDPYLCAEQVKLGINEGQFYYLVGWTKDPENVSDVVDILRDLNLTPVTFVAMEKEKYRISENVYDHKSLFMDIKDQFKQTEKIEEFLGQVILKEEDSVLINCIVLDDPGTFEVRRFDLLPFQNHVILDKGSFVKIRITTKPGSRTFEFFQDSEDLSHLFKKSDDFEDFDDLSFLKG